MKTIILVLILSIIPFFGINSKTKSLSNFLSIHIIDVGQGDSILIKTPNNKNILVDGGDENSQNLIKSYLKKENIKSLDIVIATHPHADHIGSLDYIIDNFSVKAFYMPQKESDSKAYNNILSSCNSKNLDINYLYKDDIINITDDINITVLAPSYIQEDDNLNSIIFNLNYKDKSFLFTGDAETPNEIDITSSFELDDVDFLKVGHHGSNTSTSSEFLEKTTPDMAVISCGYKNSYGHPHQQTLDNLDKNNILTYRTDLLGDLVFYSDGDVIFTKK
ncbi:MAG: ComEC/Rec2 family competence protein [Romboutsia sp.]